MSRLIDPRKFLDEPWLGIKNPIRWDEEKKKEYRSRQLDSLELAWAAGFFDGEGSVGAYKRLYGTLFYVQLNQYNSTEELERFVRAVGMETRVRGPYQRKESLRYDISYSGTSARLVMEKLEPLLCSRKRSEFRSALSKLNVQA